MDRLVATEMRRDNGTIWSGNDIVVFVFDTFNDRRNALSFTVNALGGRTDGQVINERQFNPDWNPVWELQDRPLRGRLDDGGGHPVQVAALSARARRRSGASTPCA